MINFNEPAINAIFAKYLAEGKITVRDMETKSCHDNLIIGDKQSIINYTHMLKSFQNRVKELETTIQLSQEIADLNCSLAVEETNE